MITFPGESFSYLRSLEQQLVSSGLHAKALALLWFALVHSDFYQTFRDQVSNFVERNRCDFPWCMAGLKKSVNGLQNMWFGLKNNYRPLMKQCFKSMISIILRHINQKGLCQLVIKLPQCEKAESLCRTRLLLTKRVITKKISDVLHAKPNSPVVCFSNLNLRILENIKSRDLLSYKTHIPLPSLGL